MNHATYEEIHTEQKTKEKTNRTKWIIVGIIIVILAALISGYAIYNTPANKLSRQLDLGNCYLEEQNYEQAVVEFDKAIDIDPMSVEAYLGKAKAYESMDDIDMALQTLEEGYDLTGDERLKEKTSEIENEINSQLNVTEDQVASEIQVGVKETVPLERIIEINDYNLSHLSVYYLTYEQLESVYQPLAELLEKYLSVYQNNEKAWEALARIYLHMGKMELCLNTRQKGYEITRYEYLKPEVFISTFVNATTTYDEYGRVIKDYWLEGTLDGSAQTDIYEYENSDKFVAYTWEASNWTEKRVYKYDNLGRISEIYQTILHDDVNDELYIEYEYEDNNSVLCK